MVSLKVLDILGREVATLVAEYKTAGIHEARFDATMMSSGIYFYRLDAGGKSVVQRMVLINNIIWLYPQCPTERAQDKFPVLVRLLDALGFR